MIVNTDNKRHFSVMLGSAVFVLAINAQAQGRAALEEIVVTANKRVEKIQDVSKSIQVVTGSALQQQNITSIGDLQKLVPTIAGEGQTLAIRGVATGASLVNAPNKVGIVLDGVPQPSSTTYANNLYDIQRIEVLPGPQGTLAGRNATGGLVNMVTYGPEPELTGHVNVLGTSDEQYRASAVVAGPINDNIQYSTSLYYDWFQGLTKNINLDKWSSTRTFGLRQKLKFLVSESFTVDLTALYQNYHKDGDVLVPPLASANFFWPYDIKRRPFSEFQPGVTASPTNTEFASPRNGETDTINKGVHATFTYVTPSDLTLTWINAYQNEDLDQQQDFGLGMIPIADLGLGPLVRPEFQGWVDATSYVDTYTSEFRVNSSDDGALHYVAGLFYSDEQSERYYSRYLFPAITDSEYGSTSYAGYAHADYDLTDQWNIGGGIRYEKDKVDYASILPALPAATKVLSDGRVLDFPSRDAVVSGGNDGGDFFNFDIGAKYQMTPDVMFYVTYAEAQQGPIYDSSDSAALSAGVPLQTLPEESVEAFETGMKAQFFDQALTLNVSLFHSEYDNYQVQTSVVDASTGIVNRKLASVGKVRTKGVEVSASAFPTERLRTDLNLAYTDAKILSFPGAPCYREAPASECFVVNPGTPSEFETQGDLAGNSLPFAPKVRATLILDYSVPLDIQGLEGMEAFITPLIKYQSKQHADLLLHPLSYVDDKIFVDVNVGVRNDKWSAEAFVTNLEEADQRRFVPQTGIAGTGVQNVIERVNYRYYGARFRYNF